MELKNNLPLVVNRVPVIGRENQEYLTEVGEIFGVKKIETIISKKLRILVFLESANSRAAVREALEEKGWSIEEGASCGVLTESA